MGLSVLYYFPKDTNISIMSIFCFHHCLWWSFLLLMPLFNPHYLRPPILYIMTLHWLTIYCSVSIWYDIIIDVLWFTCEEIVIETSNISQSTKFNCILSIQSHFIDSGTPISVHLLLSHVINFFNNVRKSRHSRLSRNLWPRYVKGERGII